MYVISDKDFEELQRLCDTAIAKIDELEGKIKNHIAEEETNV